jgi:hypothetical protein
VVDIQHSEGRAKAANVEAFTSAFISFPRRRPSLPVGISAWAEGIGMPKCPVQVAKLAQSQESLKDPNYPITTSFVGCQLTDSELEAGRNLNVQLRL